mmetsp:Transcript_92526/g.160756  ORF Transcript_92526/g.160756 Transcript_92526/m.160756 type:complete len:471 (-) Transcript_92526:59-1471(-)
MSALDVSFFELDRLFSESARALHRKLQRKKRKQRELNPEQKEADRSRTPPRKAGRFGKLPNFGGWTGKVDKLEKTIVASGLPQHADEKSVWAHFSKCGTVCDVHILRNRYEVTTGICIIEFLEDEAVARACIMGDLLGIKLQVKRAGDQLNKGGNQPKKMMTRSQFTQQVLSGLKTGSAPVVETTSGPNMRKLHIKNLRPVVTEDDMRGIFKPFGEFEAFKMGDQECWITFQNNNDAQDATSSMQHFQLVGQELQISIQSVEVAPPPAPPPPEETITQSMKNDSDFGATGGTGSVGRIELMKKLMTSHVQQGVPTVAGQPQPANAPPATPASGVMVPPPPPPPSAAASTGMQLPPVPKPGSAQSRTLLLQGMFTPSVVNLQKDPRFYEDIREDTHEECSKFGKVLHVTVDPRGASGLIYILFEVPAQRQAAEMALNGRWFEGKKIAAAGIDDSIWQALAAQAQGQSPPVS